MLRSEHAISPVLGGLLLVAVAIGLAIGVWAIAETEVTKADAKVPEVTWSVAQSTDSAHVVSAPPGVSWREYSVRADGDLRFALGTAGPGSTPLPSGQKTRIDFEGDVQGGAVLDFCADGTAASVTVQLFHIERDRLVNTFPFSDVAAC